MGLSQLISQAAVLDTEDVVVITGADTLASWQAQLRTRKNARVFSETDFLVALDTIINDQPDVIALDVAFAATARGAALVARVKADPVLSRAAVRLLTADTPDPLAASLAELTGDTFSLLSQPLDQCGTRRATRYNIQGEVDAKVNGTACRLVNLSVTGSQMVAPMRLRPSEGIRLTISDTSTDLRLVGTIAWVHLEIADRSGNQRYRFGVEFHGADHAALAQFCARHSAES